MQMAIAMFSSSSSSNAAACRRNVPVNTTVCIRHAYTAMPYRGQAIVFKGAGSLRPASFSRYPVIPGSLSPCSRAHWMAIS
jgi:hypothetical protein